MLIHRYLPDFNRFDCFVLDADGERAVNEVNGDALNGGWVLPATVELENGSIELGDFPGITGSETPVFSARAWRILSNELRIDAEILPFPSPIGEYVIVNVLTIEDCLDQARSTISRYADGSISSIDDAVFRDDVRPTRAIFRATDFPPHVFVTEEFKAAVTRHKLRGLRWPKKK